jgi:hypothetical protein
MIINSVTTHKQHIMTHISREHEIIGRLRDEGAYLAEEVEVLTVPEKDRDPIDEMKG